MAFTLFHPINSAAQDGAGLFGAKCVACHGSKGEGTQVGPALRSDPFVLQGSPDDIKNVILKGRPEKDKKYPNIIGPMPPGLATEAEADALVKYLKGDLQK